MNPKETGHQTDPAKLSHFQSGSYPALLNDTSAPPADDPSPLSSSDDFQLPASATNWSTNQRLADLEAKLFERQEKCPRLLDL